MADATTASYPLAFDVEYPEQLSRWLIFVKWLLAIPHIIIFYFLGLGLFLALVAAWFAILFTKRFPASLFRFVVGVTRWQYRVSAYVYLMRDEYPPFSMARSRDPATSLERDDLS